MVPDRRDFESDVHVAYARPGEEEMVEASVSHDADPRILRLSLPADLAPGTYKGVLRYGEEERPVELEVEAAPGLRVIPEQLRVSVHPGDLVGADITVLNSGNVPIPIRAVHAFGVFMEGGVERALRLAYHDGLAEGQRRVDVIADNLAQAHPGLVKVKVQEGACEVAAGGMQSIGILLDIPATVERGRTYRGNWEVANLVYPVTITVVDDPEEDTGAPKATGAAKTPEAGTPPATKTAPAKKKAPPVEKIAEKKIALERKPK